MFYLGIDVGKFSHSVCLLNEDRQQSILQINNDQAGFVKLQKKLSEIDLSNLLVGMEATGHYFLNLYDFLLRQGLASEQIALLNPLQVKSFRNTNLRGTKSDNVDAARIASLLRFGDFKRCNISVDNMINLRELTRLRADLMKNITDLKRKMIAVLDRIFPEFGRIFANRFNKTTLSLISNYPTPEEMAALSLDKLTKIVKSLSKKGLRRDKIKKLHYAARNSIGISFGKEAFKIELEILLTRLKVFQDQVTQLDEKIKEIVTEFNSPLFTIPGIGEVTGATVLAEIGDINKFSSAIKLRAFAGLDPKTRESGTYQGKTPISKRGSKYLRNAIWYSAMVACRVNPTFKKKYRERRAKGKSHRYAITAAANKLTTIIYHILKYNCSFKAKLV